MTVCHFFFASLAVHSWRFFGKTSGKFQEIPSLGDHQFSPVSSMARMETPSGSFIGRVIDDMGAVPASHIAHYRRVSLLWAPNDLFSIGG
jgi:hypothetical protein